MLPEITLGRCQMLDEFWLDRLSGTFFSKAERTSGVMNDLDGLDAREFVKEPAAAGVHEHGVALHLEQLQDGYLLLSFEGANSMIPEERGAVFLGTIENEVDVVVAHGPGIADV